MIEIHTLALVCLCVGLFLAGLVMGSQLVSPPPLSRQAPRLGLRKSYSANQEIKTLSLLMVGITT